MANDAGTLELVLLNHAIECIYSKRYTGKATTLDKTWRITAFVLPPRRGGGALLAIRDQRPLKDIQWHVHDLQGLTKWAADDKSEYARMLREVFRDLGIAA